MKLVTKDRMKVPQEIKRSKRDRATAEAATTRPGGAAQKRVRTDGLQKKSRRTPVKSFQRIVDLYQEVSVFLDAVERAWQAAERVQAALEKYDPEACAFAERSDVFDLD